MADYTKLVDDETWDFIRETERWYPPDAMNMTVAEQRRVYDAMCRAFVVGHPEGITARDRDADGVAVRHYQCVGEGQDALVLYMHGGGFILGGLESHDGVCAEICAATGHDVISVDYRLSPEHVHPAAFGDCQTVLNWARARHGRSVILVGDSAGGTLAAALAHANRKSGFLGQVLIYPALGGNPDRGSYLAHAEAPLLTRADVLYYETVRSGGAAPHADPTFAPLHDIDFKDLPPTVAIAAQCDPLADDVVHYADQIRMAGGQVLAITETGLVHGYLRARHTVSRARASFARINTAIALLGSGRTPTAHDLAD